MVGTKRGHQETTDPVKRGRKKLDDDHYIAKLNEDIKKSKEKYEEMKKNRPPTNASK